MATDIERKYTGTNFVVITLIVLLVAVVSYLIFAQASDVADDNLGKVQKESALR